MKFEFEPLVVEKDGSWYPHVKVSLNGKFYEEREYDLPSQSYLTSLFNAQWIAGETLASYQRTIENIFSLDKVN